MNIRRVLAMVLAMMLAAGGISFLCGSVLPAAAADGAPTDSAVTESGKGEFANLKVTVSQTKNLINQVITVSWTGGVPTRPASGAFGVNYLQIMQCWGDDPNGPDRTQCQYGGSVTQLSPAAGAWVRSRQVSYGGSLTDPNEGLKQPAGNVNNVFVPFWAVGNDKPTDPATSNRNDFFDSQVTNEIPLARTHGDGTGLELFEVQTVRQSAGLGCGDSVTTGQTTTPRRCWLVVVPRGSTEVDGSTRSGDGEDRLVSSPLSQSNWDNRIYFPLEFLPVGQTCPFGSAERRIIGHELATDAVGRWQSALCANGGALYSYTQLTDDVTRNQVSDGSSPGLGLVTNPIPPDQLPSGRSLVYAPVGLSGLVIAFSIEHQPPANAPPADLQLDGQRFTSMKLNARLVAKLLTQSYQGAVAGVQDYLKGNPAGLTVDPEFLDLNPEYKGFANFITPPDALVQLGNSDVTSLLWSWIKADPDASSFIAGVPDKYGMVVNPNNKNITLPTSGFPRNDQSCVSVNLGNSVTGQICTLDGHPFANDMHDAGRSISRGDSQARTTVLGDDGKTPSSKKVDRQVPGQRALLAVVDAATASRYGLSAAALRNAAGQFVAPTTASLLAGEAAMKPSGVAGVVVPQPDTTDPAAYPLTALSYAVAEPSKLDAAAGKDYATFLRYAVGGGQTLGIEPGQLPFGMAPLPDALKAQTTTAATTIEQQAGKVPSPPPTQQSTDLSANAGAGTAGSATGSGTSSGSAQVGSNSGSGPTTSGGPAGTPGTAGPSTASNVAQQAAGVLRRTPALPAPAWVGGLLIATLISGGLAATSSPVLQSPAAYRIGTAVRRRVRKGVRPTE